MTFSPIGDGRGKFSTGLLQGAILTAFESVVGSGWEPSFIGVGIWIVCCLLWSSESRSGLWAEAASVLASSWTNFVKWSYRPGALSSWGDKTKD